MNTTSIRSTTTIPIILTVMILTGLATPASASLADSAGIWETQRLEATMVAPDGAKASADLGPARTAALGHLDSDGVVDLVVVYGLAGKAFAVVTLGDIRFRMGAFHDRERELAGLPPERPFATEGVVYPLPFAPDWVAVGDWDSDGDFDVVFASQGRAQLFWMAGDGQGRLDAGRMIDFEGGVTAFVSGDVNRRDGLEDLVLAVNGNAGAALLFFENPECDASGYGEGKVYLGSQSVTTDATGACSFGFSAPALTPGWSVSAIAMAPDSNTSEFSLCFTVPQGAGHIFSDGFESSNFSQWSDVVGQ